MSRKRKATYYQQGYDRLNQLRVLGIGTKKTKKSDEVDDRIHAYSTYHKYLGDMRGFCRFLNANGIRCPTLMDAACYIPDYIEWLIDNGYSPHTIKSRNAALNMLFQLRKGDPNYYTTGKTVTRSREKITRGRDYEMLEEQKNWELFTFCLSTGLRRHELMALRGYDLTTREELQRERAKACKDRNWGHVDRINEALSIPAQYYVHVRKGKGGRERYAPVVGQFVVDMMCGMDPDAKVWPNLPSNYNIHGLRAYYAVTIYNLTARPIKSIPFDKVYANGRKGQSDAYRCRADMQGLVLDRHAMLLASRALGHNRIDVIAQSYLWPMWAPMEQSEEKAA